jgi:hypothetical protein
MTREKKGDEKGADDVWRVEERREQISKDM